MRVLRCRMIQVAAFALIGALGMRSAAAAADVLYIGDGGDGTIKRFDASSGHPLRGNPFVTGLHGPRGLLFDGSTATPRLLVVNQNVALNIPGEVLQYDGDDGTFLGPLVASTDEDAPFTPRGAVLRSNVLYVANLSTASGRSPGNLLRYDGTTGALLGSTGAADISNVVLPSDELHPRGVVVGPDSLVYVSVRSLKNDGLGGHVLRFDPDGSFVDVFIADEGGAGRLNRPEGLVFGPDGCLYITSFRADPMDTDAIRIYDGAGAFQDKIDLYDPAVDPRAFAQAILFGPGGRLFVPINNTGEVRRYNVMTQACHLKTQTRDVFVPAGTSLLEPWYLTFRNTDPATLQYVK